MIPLLLRTLIIYIFLLAAMRLAGKRQVGELQLSELTTTLMLSELAVLPISDTDIPLLYAILPILTLLCCEIFISFGVSRTVTLRKFFFGAPSLLIFRGVLNRKEMKKLRIGTAELLSELRLKDIADISEVYCAILEDNGKLSVFKKKDLQPLTASDAQIPLQESGISLPVLISGELMPDSMRHIGVDEAWVDHMLEKQGLTRRDVLLMSVDELHRITWILRDAPECRIIGEAEG